MVGRRYKNFLVCRGSNKSKWMFRVALSLSFFIQSSGIVICYIYSEVIAVTGSAISPKLQIKCFLAILLLIFSGRTKNKENITSSQKKRF